MSLWGSTIDASKATKYSLRPATDETLPDVTEDDPAAASSSSSSSSSISSTSTSIAASTTKQYTKPTDHLPDDHTHAEGESDKATFPDHHNSTTGGMTPTPDEGYFPHMSDLLANQTWLFGGVGVVVLFAIAAGIFFWRRRVIRRRGEYSSVADDEMALTSMLHGGRAVDGTSRRGGRKAAGTKELYDAFGEVSDDGHDEDEDQMALTGSGRSPMAGLRYHDGFLDDDGGDSNAASPAVRYRDDEPSSAVRAVAADDGLPEREEKMEREASSPSGSGSGSWEHAQASSSEALNKLPP